MATIFLTNGNDSRLLDRPGTYVVDGLAGRDTMEFGTSASTDYEITLGADGGVHVDSLSGASQPFNGTFYNFEVFVFRNRSERIELATYFSASQPPTVTITDFTSGTATGPVSYDLAFSKPVTGLAADDFQVSGGSVIAVAGSSSGYTVTVQPTAGSEGTISFTLKAAAVQDAAGLTNAATSAAAQPYDTLTPRVAAGSPTVGATGVSTSGPIVIDFSEPVHGGTGTVVLRDSAGTQLGFWSSSDVGALLSGTRLTLTLAPGRTLPAASTLRVELGAAVVQDTAGNNFAASSFTFTTAGVVTQTGGAGNDVFTLTRGSYAVDGGGGIEAEDRSAGQDDGVDILDEVFRFEGRRFAIARCAAPDVGGDHHGAIRHNHGHAGAREATALGGRRFVVDDGGVPQAGARPRSGAWSARYCSTADDSVSTPPSARPSAGTLASGTSAR